MSLAKPHTGGMSGAGFAKREFPLGGTARSALGAI